MCTKFDYSDFSRFTNIISDANNENGPCDLTTLPSGLVCHPRAMTFYDQPTYHIRSLSSLGTKQILWVDTVRYLGVFIVSSSRFCYSFDNAKKSFYRAFNAVFSKVGRVASQIVVIELLMFKCVPVLYYGSECCPVSKSQFNSLEFALPRSFMKIFNTRSKEIANYCMEMFNVQNPL